MIFAGAPAVVAAPTASNSIVLGVPAEPCGFDFNAGLPSGWSSYSAASGGTVSYAAGNVSLSGWQLSRDGAYPREGSSIEWSGQFSGASPYQHAGYGRTQFSTTSAAIFSTQAGGNLFAYSNGSTVNLGASYFGASRQYKINWRPTDFQFLIDGVQVALLSNTWTTGIALGPLWSDGVVDSAPLIVDNVELAPCDPPATTTTTAAPTTTTTAAPTTTTTAAPTTTTTTAVPSAGGGSTSADERVSNGSWAAVFGMVSASLVSAIIAAKGVGLLRPLFRFPR
jgi:hypothetical protein